MFMERLNRGASFFGKFCEMFFSICLIDVKDVLRLIHRVMFSRAIV